VLYNLGFVNHLDRVDVLAGFVTHFVYFAEATHSDIAVGQAFEVVTLALLLLATHDRGRQEEDAVLYVVGA